jgi:CRISPR-associated protein Cas4
MKKEITGVMVYYYVVCSRKLWYFYHEIQIEQDNENVKIGKIIDENSYQRDNKHINIDNVINIDFIRKQGVLHEVKKSRKLEDAGILQVKYYLYYLKQRGVDEIKAKIDYPLLKQTLELELTPEDVELVEKILEKVKVIVEQTCPPKLEKKNICKVCAYYDLCYI